MADDDFSPEAQLARQLRQHLESLRAAGIEWLPAGPDLRNLSAAPLMMATPAAPHPAEPLSEKNTPDLRRQELTVLAQSVSCCTRCPELASTRTQTVFGVGPVDADLCFVGEAPGFDEDRLGEPFVGPAGQLLNRMIAACGMKREEVFICNILRCRPPGNRLPLPNEAHNCREYLERTLELVKPKFLCALGACAAQNLLGSSLTIGKLRGRFHDYNGIPVLCTYHPAYLLRTPEKKREVWEDLKKLLARMGRSVPSK